MLTDAAALAIALAAIRIAQRPADACRTFGYYRFEILAAALNAALLFIIALYILFEAYKRLRSPPRGSIAADAALRNDRPGSELRGDACAKRCRCESHICAHPCADSRLLSIRARLRIRVLAQSEGSIPSAACVPQLPRGLDVGTVACR